MSVDQLLKQFSKHLSLVVGEWSDYSLLNDHHVLVKSAKMRKSGIG